MIRFFILSLFLLLAAVPCFPQGENIDSLENELKNAQKQDRVDLLLQLSKLYSYTDLKKGTLYAHDAMELSRELSYKQGLAESLYRLGVTLRSQGLLDSSIFFFDESIGIYKQLKNREGMARVLRGKGNTLRNKGNLSGAIEHYMQSMEIYAGLNHVKEVAAVKSNIGLSHYNLGQYDRAIGYFLEATKVLDSLDERRRYAYAMNNLAMVYQDKGELKKALEIYLIAEKELEALNDQYALSHVYNGISNLYKLTGEYESALAYYRRSIRISKEVGNIQGIAIGYFNIGVIFIDQGPQDSAYYYLEESRKFTSRVNSLPMRVSLLNALGVLYLNSDRHIAAARIFREALPLAKQSGDYKNHIDLLGNLGAVHSKRGAFDSSFFYLEKSRKMALEYHYLEGLWEANSNLSKLFEDKGEISKAFQFYKSAISWKDSIYNQEREQQVRELKTKYETEKKEQQIVLQQAQIEKDLARIKQQKTFNYALTGGILFTLALGSLVYRNYHQKKKANILLSEKNEKISEQHKEITDSIQYASRIQTAVLPPEEYLTEIIPEHFIFFRPRDIVSGDFYWMKQQGNVCVLTAADCTGHGVPGAFMSMLGITLLNEIVSKHTVDNAAAVLNELREQVKLALRQTGKANEAKDGMDLALCVVNLDAMEMHYAGAFNPLYFLRDGKLEVFKADRMPIGIYLNEKTEFTNHVIQLEKGDQFYLFSDGFVDQFGGEKQQKFKTRRFKDLIKDIHHLPMEAQRKQLEMQFDTWKGKLRQVDDLVVLGLRI